MPESRGAPSLFAQENRESCEAVHKYVRQVVELGTETTAIPVDADLLAKAEEVLKGYGLVRPDRVQLKVEGTTLQ